MDIQKFYQTTTKRELLQIAWYLALRLTGSESETEALKILVKDRRILTGKK